MNQEGRREKELKTFLQPLIEYGKSKGLIYASTIYKPFRSVYYPLWNKFFLRKRIKEEINICRKNMTPSTCCYFSIKHNLDYLIFQETLLHKDCKENLSKKP